MNEWIVQFQVLLNVHLCQRKTASVISQLVKIFGYGYFEGGDLTDY